jgi:hypothetical protein
MTNLGGWRTLVLRNLTLPIKVGAPSFRVLC